MEMIFQDQYNTANWNKGAQSTHQNCLPNRRDSPLKHKKQGYAYMAVEEQVSGNC